LTAGAIHIYPRPTEGSGVRNPVRSETDAFHIAVGCAVVLGAAIALGALVTPWAGVALCVGAIAGAFIWEIATKDPDRRQPLREAADVGRSTTERERPRVLVVANRTLPSDTLRGEIAGRARDGADVHIVVPILCSRITTSPRTPTSSSARRASGSTTRWPGRAPTA
jgi:hypothetical protein